MLSIQNNLLAMNADNFFKINSKNNKKSTERLSSGYRINRASDDAAGLSISEKMRRQIRGLMQGTSNAQDGISFVQVADGAMDEVHSILQRMNELTIQSLNGTLTDSDRAALNAEFDQLRSEIDRISDDTEYNEQPVFEEHESSYYQLSGNKKWDDNQIHTVPELNNELNIHLPDYYEPSDYTLKVPAGTYTTQELIDEIDTALENMSPPNPGFVFEYTDAGICKLNFERSDGTPTEISSVDGSLSYLLYDSFNGSASSSLLGTTVFSMETPLTIRSGENNQLGFYVESANGSNYISITIPSGKYYRSEMIDKINQLLSQIPEAAGIVAKEYEDSCIQITGGDSVSIVGLKGNMFKLDSASASIKYSSVFYDNVRYGSSNGTAASIRGKAYYRESITDKIYLSDDNNNNILRFTVNDEQEYTITFKDGGYTMVQIRDEINSQLGTQLNEYLKAYETDLKASISDEDEVEEKLKEMEAKLKIQANCSSEYVKVFSPSNSTYEYSMQYLTLSNLLKGSSSSLVFDTSETVYANTYNALFRDTNYLAYKKDGETAKLTGRAVLKDAFTLPDNASLTFKVNNQNYTINISDIRLTYANGNDLKNELNNYINSHFDAIKGKIEFDYNSSSGTISIITEADDIQEINFDDNNKNTTYKQLFVGTTEVRNSISTNWYTGSVTQKEGSTETVVKNPDVYAYAILSKDRPNTINITKDTKTLRFDSSDGTKTITLNEGNYTIAEIVKQINDKLKPSGDSCFNSIKVAFDSNNNRLNLTADLKKSNTAGSYYIRFDTSSSSAWTAILGTHPDDWNPTVTKASEYTTGTRNAVSDSTTLDSSNNELILTIGGQVYDSIYIADGSYNRESLEAAVQKAVTDKGLGGNVTVSINKDTGRLEFCSSAGAITVSGSFYNNIAKNTKDETVKQGTYNSFENAYIIGRKDLSTEHVEIVNGANDVFTFDFTYTADRGVGSYTKEISVKIPEGTYTGDEIAEAMQKEIEEYFDNDEDLRDYFEINVTIGGEMTGVVGANDDTALQIKVTKKDGVEPAVGQYVIDGVRGSAASFLFYKSTINPNATYVTGTRNLSNGITFNSGQNVLTLSADSVPYKYTFPENTNYTAEEFVNLLNDMFENGDDNGNSAPLTASIDNGYLKIAHKSLGSHSITDIGGSARGKLFLEESGRNSRDPIYLLVGAETEDLFEIPRTCVNSCSLAINSITISKTKYGEKAVNRIKEAITMLSSRRSTYGSVQNRLEHTINSNNNVIENTQASESAIRDADIAYETMEYAKNKFLMQASQTILAQANQNPNLVLSLLKN